MDLFARKGKQFAHAYWELLMEVKKQGGQPVVVRGLDSYLGDGVFEDYWTPNEDKINSFTHVNQKIKVDVLLDKKDFAATFGQQSKITVINPADISLVANDKSEAHKLFGHLMPKSVIVERERQFGDALAKIESDKGVVKGALHYTS